MSFQEKIDYHLTYSNRTSKHNSHHNCYKPKNKRNHDETLETDIKSNHIVFLGVCQHLGYIYIDWRCWCSLPKKKKITPKHSSPESTRYLLLLQIVSIIKNKSNYSLYIFIEDHPCNPIFIPLLLLHAIILKTNQPARMRNSEPKKIKYFSSKVCVFIIIIILFILCIKRIHTHSHTLTWQQPRLRRNNN